MECLCSQYRQPFTHTVVSIPGAATEIHQNLGKLGNEHHPGDLVPKRRVRRPDGWCVGPPDDHARGLVALIPEVTCATKVRARSDVDPDAMRAVVVTAGEPTLECLQIVLTGGADGLGSRLRINIGVAGVGDEEVWSGQGDWKVQESIGHQTGNRRRAAMSR